MDAEKATSSAKTDQADSPVAAASDATSLHAGHVAAPRNLLLRGATRVLRSKLTETRGIDRVEPADRYPPTHKSYSQMLALYTSANMTANNVALGFVGPVTYGLSFGDAALCACLGTVVGSLCTGYMAMFGPRSGCRTLIISRYHMGWWPNRVCVVLNLILALGYGMINSVVMGQMLSAVAGGRLSVIAGIIINSAVTLLVTEFGMPVFHVFERWAWVPTAFAIIVLFAVAGPHFNLERGSIGSAATIDGDRLSMFALCVSATSGWAPGVADYYVYFPERTSKPHIFFFTWLGEVIGNVVALVAGAGIGSGISNRASWEAASKISPGALLVAGYDEIGTFGKFCSVVLAIGILANNVPGIYSAGLNFQCLGAKLHKVPRLFWNCFSVVVCTVCAAAGRDHLYDIFEDFLSLMGYWVLIWIAIALEDNLIFRKGRYNWEDWNTQSKLPVGVAAFTAFCIGWAGAVLCMDQAWFTGPIARLVGEHGADMGVFVAPAWTALVFPPLRWLELKRIGR